MAPAKTQYEMMKDLSDSQAAMGAKLAVLVDRSNTQVKHNEGVTAWQGNHDREGCPLAQTNEERLGKVDEKVEAITVDAAVARGFSSRQVGTFIGGSSVAASAITWLVTKVGEWWNG